VFECVYLYVLALSWATAHTKCMQLMSVCLSTRSLATSWVCSWRIIARLKKNRSGPPSPKISLEASVLDGRALLNWLGCWERTVVGAHRGPQASLLSDAQQLSVLNERLKVGDGRLLTQRFGHRRGGASSCTHRGGCQSIPSSIASSWSWVSLHTHS
jgi:hypothetical protein